MLSRYRSVSVAENPGCYNSPVQRFEEAAEHRRWLLEQRLGEGASSAGDLLRTGLRLWAGPLEGIAHQVGQFTALEEGPAAEAAALPPELLAQDLELLLGVAELTKGILYGGYGSESDFNVVPIILEPRLGAGAATRAQPATNQPVQPSALYDSQTAATAQEAGDRTIDSASSTQDDVSSTPGGGSGDGDGGSGGGGGGAGGWWPLEEAVATPLTCAEVASSLGVAPELVSRVEAPIQFASKQEFLRYMHQKHIRRLQGGEELELDPVTHGAAADARAAPGDPRVAASSPAGVEAGAATAQGARQQLQQLQLQTGDAEEDEERGLRPPRSQAAAMAVAVGELAGAVVFPGAMQVVLGSEALGWNPIPLLWLGRSHRSGAILGLLTAVVWT